jgi:hypothetical protein
MNDVFFMLTLMNIKLRDWLIEHLELIIQMFNQKFFNMHNFLFRITI